MSLVHWPGPKQTRFNECSYSTSAHPMRRLPAVDGHLVEIDLRGTAGAPSVDLEVGQERRAPTEGECRRHGRVDRLLSVVEPDRLVGNIAFLIAEVAHLQMMPGVDAPVLDIAGGGGMQPAINRSRWRTGVFSVIP